MELAYVQLEMQGRMSFSKAKSELLHGTLSVPFKAAGMRKEVILEG